MCEGFQSQNELDFPSEANFEMNSTDLDKFTQVDELYVTVFAVLFYSCCPLLLLYFIIFPFYVFVNKVNRQRDEKMTIFPITNHFYLMTKVTTPVLLCFISCFLHYYYYYKDKTEYDHRKLYYIIVPYLMAISLYALYLSNQIFHLLIAFLAIERFLIYFLPTIEKRIVSLQNYVNKNIKVFYLAFLIKDIIYGGALIVDFIKNDQAQLTLWRIFFLIIYYTTQILLFLSALLYIPIMISVRKLSHLTSAQVNHPQRYIFWQTVVIVIFKTLTLPVIVAQSIVFRSVFESGFYQLLIEMITIPLLLTTSYLGCNKRNVTVLLSSFKLKHFLKVIFGGENATVEPQQYVASIHSTV